MYQGKFRNKESGEPVPQDEPDDEIYIQDEYIPDEVPPVKEEKKRRRGPRITGVIFYLLFFAAIGAFVFWGKGQVDSLGKELEIYEQAQPDRKCTEIFDSLFADPDWGALYAAAGIQDTAYEGAETYASWMEQRMEGKALAYHQVSTDAPNTRKYAVLLDEDPVASFTMVNRDPEGEFPDWQKGDVELFFTRDESYFISMPASCSASVNGVALDDSAVVQRGSIQVTGQDGTVLNFNETCVLQVEGLLVMPEISITDAEGSPVELVYEEETRTFSTPEPAAETISEEKAEIVMDTVKTYCLYMVNKVNQGEIAKHFKRGTDTYKFITGSDLLWVQKDSGASFADEQITDYASFGEDRFAARVSLTFRLKRQDGSFKESKVDESLFFEKVNGDQWVCTQMTAVDIFEPAGEIWFTFRNGDETLAKGGLSAADTRLSCPVISVPEGQSFAGWAVKTTAEDGSPILQLMLVPNEEGEAVVPAGMERRPMTLYPVFTPAA